MLKVDAKTAKKKAMVYTFEVAGFYNYFVSGLEVLVHNNENIGIEIEYGEIP